MWSGDQLGGFDRSVQTDARAKPTRPGVGAASVASGKEAEQIAVGIDDDRVALAPERVPGLLVPLIARGDDAPVHLVDLVARAALEGKLDPVSNRILDPLVVDAAEDLDCVPGELDAVAFVLDMRLCVLVLGNLEPEQAVEPERLGHVLHCDPD